IRVQKQKRLGGKVESLGRIRGVPFNAEHEIWLEVELFEAHAVVNERWRMPGGGNLHPAHRRIDDQDLQRDELPVEHLRAKLAIDLGQAPARIARLWER